jgi:Flp pilus assembly protein CpaB
MGRRTIVLVIALLLAALSAVAVFNYLSNVEDDIRGDIEEVVVFRATRGIPTGTPGSQAQGSIAESTALVVNVEFEGSVILCTGPATSGGSPDACLNNPNNLGDVLRGKVSAGPISRGQLITTQMFIEEIELRSVSLSESLPQGKVAIALRPSDVASAGGFIRPGDKVNLIASDTVNISQTLQFLADPELRQLLADAGFVVPFTDIALPEPPTTTLPPVVPPNGAPVGEDEPPPPDPLQAFIGTLDPSFAFTQTVMQNLEVLAVGADTRPSPLGTGLAPQGSQILVFEVTPEQAEKLQFIQNNTSIALTLLPSEFPYTPFEARGVIIDDIFDLVIRIQDELEAAFGS